MYMRISLKDNSKVYRISIDHRICLSRECKRTAGGFWEGCLVAASLLGEQRCSKMPKNIIERGKSCFSGARKEL